MHVSRLARSCVAVLVLVTVSFLAHAQNTGTGTYAYASLDSFGFDSVNIGNLNTHFVIPIVNKSGRGLPFQYSLEFDSLIWTPTTSGSSASWVPDPSFGLHGYLLNDGYKGYLSYSTSNRKCFDDPNDPGFWEWMPILSNYIYHDEFGVSHSFKYSDNTCTDVVTGDGSTSDGSGFSFDGAYVHSRSGLTLDVPTYVNGATSTLNATITDSNGNQITNDLNGTFTDTTGLTPLTITGGGSASSPRVFTYKTTTGTATITLSYSTKTVKTAFGCSGITEFGPISKDLPHSITLPDNSTYIFNYESTPGTPGDVTGRIGSITLPSGGTISYSYSGGSNGIECADGSTAGLTRSLNSDSGSAASSRTYTRTTGTTTSHTEIVDGLPTPNHLAYDFVEPTAGTAVYYETNRSVYQGAESGTPVVARHTCYNGAASPCTTTALTLPISQIDTYETLDGIETHGATAKYNTYGMQTEADIYDFGSSARGSLLRKELWTYNPSIPSLVATDKVYDGSGTLSGQTLNTYDGSTPTASSGVPQHVAVSGARGNATGVTLYASSSVSYAQSATYEDTGSILTITAPTGTTSVSYDSSFVYPTGTVLPTPSSGVTLNAGESYDTTHTGLPLTSTDPNTAITAVHTYDSMLRPTEIDYSDTGKTTISYSPTQTGVQTYQTLPSTYSDTEVIVDGYGRSSRAAVANGPGGSSWYQQDTCYDANGKVAFSAYRYQGTGFSAGKICSGSGDSYTYDVLGRLLKIIRGNGETVTYTYTGRATRYTDENTAKRITQVDGLGRTTIVCEVTSTTMQSSGAPVSCGTDITGFTGYLTTYAYTLATPTTTITQGSQTRVFTSDWLGRPTSVTEPEVSTSTPTTYSYAYNSTGLVVTRKRPKANQTNASTLTTTITQYDSLGRVVSITYDDGTPTKTFAYDASAGWSDLTQANLKGRLSIASVTGASTVFSYDSTGRITDLDECLPSGCGTVAYNRKLHYTYDLAGNLHSSSDGGGVTTSYTVSLANELLTLTSSLNNTMNPTSLISNMQNGPNGPVHFSLGNGLSNVFGYDSLGRLNAGWVCNGSTSPNCSGGTTSYQFSANWQGTRVNGSNDSILSQTSTYGYDDFNRLTARTVTSGTTQNFTYVYDRYGNRWQQNLVQGTTGPQPQFSFSTTTNRITTAGFAYDAAGNMTNDSSHTYTYDAEGNITAVDGGSTAQYTYNALNQRVRTTIGSYITEFLFNANGQRVSIWDGTTRTEGRGQYYWGGKPVGYYVVGNSTHFQHQDWLGTERVRTSYNGAVEATFTSLPFGDAQTTASGTDGDAYHFARLDEEVETGTVHAQFRQYSSTQGRWMRPDRYFGSYDSGNPQSLNRYAYVLDNPLFYTDPDGDSSDPSVCALLGYLCSGNGGGGGGAFYGGLEQLSSNFYNYVTVYDDQGNSYTYSLNTFASFVPNLGPGITMDQNGNLDCSGTPCGYIKLSFGGSGASSPSNGGGTGGGGGAMATNNGDWHPAKQPSAAGKYLAFLGCYGNNIMESLDDEDPLGKFLFVNAAIQGKWALRFFKVGLKVKGTPLVSVALAGIYADILGVRANLACTKEIYGSN